MDRRTITAIARFTQLMELAPTTKYSSYDAGTTMDERNRAWNDKDRIFATLLRVIRQAQGSLAEDNTAWELVPTVADETLCALLDPTMLDEEALREVEIYVREHF